MNEKSFFGGAMLLIVSKEIWQIAKAEILEDPLLVALGLRILEHADKLEAFNLKLVPSSDLKLPLRMALEATGVYNGPFGICGMCCETKQQSETIKLNCSHQFCYDCLVMYVEDGVQTSQSPVSCCQLTWKCYISITEILIVRHSRPDFIFDGKLIESVHYRLPWVPTMPYSCMR